MAPEIAGPERGESGIHAAGEIAGRGRATEALRQLLPRAGEAGLPYVELTTDVVNLASQRVITANGGVLVEEFTKPAAYGGAPSLRFRIFLPEH